jgi:hypothetical protein
VLHLLPLAAVNYYRHHTTRTTNRPSFVLSPPSVADYTGDADALYQMVCPDRDKFTDCPLTGPDMNKFNELIAAGAPIRTRVIVWRE